MSATLSYVDLAASGLVQPISTASQTDSSMEHKNALMRAFQKHNYYHQNIEVHLGIEIDQFSKWDQGSHYDNETNKSVPALIPVESSISV